MTTTTGEREKRVAQRRVKGFTKQFGQAHRNLARHAAFPLSLTPDLLYQIWANFVPEAPWEAVAHLLLSRLCRQVGYEMYEMDIADRNLLLRELKEQFGQERLDELAEFLLDYVAQRLTDNDPDTQDLREAQEWTALAYTKPNELARELAQRLSERVQQEDMGEVLRLASLAETFAEPLIESGFEPLLTYTHGMANFVYGKQETATDVIKPLLANKTSQLKIAGVNLPIPNSIVTAIGGSGQQQSSDIENLLDNLYNAFTPMPLPANAPNYVDCWEARGDVSIERDLGKTIRRSKELTYQLYSGYRGAGKTTELYRLKQYLEQRNCFVIYFAADEEDISVQDVQYTDILLACSRHLLAQLQQADSTPIANWLRDRYEDLKDFFLVEVKLEKLTIEAQLNQFAKLTAAIRTEPSQRQQIREKVEPHTETLIKALNQFIADAKQKLPDGKTQLVVIVDNLDRIVPIFRENGRSNHEEIFLDRHEQLKALACHIIYTVPISIIYSRWATDLKDIYGIPQVLPLVMVQCQDGSLYEPGIAKLKETIKRRIKPHTDLDLETEIFASPDVLEQLCRMSGGYMRDLIQLAQEAINRTDQLPISARAVQRAITELRDVYQRAVEEDQWQILAQVYKSKKIGKDNLHRSLLFSRCLLEYRYINQPGEKHTWYDVHPIIIDISKFKEAVASIE